MSDNSSNRGRKRDFNFKAAKAEFEADPAGKPNPKSATYASKGDLAYDASILLVAWVMRLNNGKDLEGSEFKSRMKVGDILKMSTSDTEELVAYATKAGLSLSGERDTRLSPCKIHEIIGKLVYTRIISRDENFFNNISKAFENIDEEGEWIHKELLHREIAIYVSDNPKDSYTVDEIRDALSPESRKKGDKTIMRILKNVQEKGIKKKPKGRKKKSDNS